MGKVKRRYEQGKRTEQDVSIPYGKGKVKGESVIWYDKSEYLVSIPYGKGKDNPNDLVKLKSDVSIPYGKGKERSLQANSVVTGVSIPYGKGKAIWEGIRVT